jgi:IPT/TIG domain-containing protein
LAVFDAAGNVVAGPRTLGVGLIQEVSANQDGTRFAVLFVSTGSTQLLILDAALNQVGFYPPSSVHGVIFSRDGNHLYVCETSSSGSVVSILDGHTAQPVARASDAMIQGVSSEIEDADESGLLFGLSNRGVSFVDVATPAALSSPAPILSAVPSLQPAEGPSSGGTPISLTGQNFSSSVQLRLGTQLASDVLIAGPTQIQANSPASVSNGAVNATAFFDNGWLALAPDAFSYGPQILQILPNAGVNSGGDSVQIYGYGFGNDATKIAVKMGAANATVTKIESVTGIAPSLGLDASYPFPLERITIQSPPGSSGKADAVVTSPTGTATSSKSFQYLQSAQSISIPAFSRFVIYDPKRRRVYLTSIDQVYIFDVQMNSFVLQFGMPGGPALNSGLRGLALANAGRRPIDRR